MWGIIESGKLHVRVGSGLGYTNIRVGYDGYQG